MTADTFETPSHDVLTNQYALLQAQLGAQLDDSETDSDDNLPRYQRLKHDDPEVTGIGSSAPTNLDDDQDGFLSRQETAATQRLRVQLLGSRARPPTGSVAANGRMINGGHNASSKPARPFALKKRARDESEDEDEGRSALGRQRRKVQPTNNTEAAAGETEHGENHIEGESMEATEEPSVAVPAAITAPSVQQSGKRRGTSYLDQVLADRASKKKKKKKKKGKEKNTDAVDV